MSPLVYLHHRIQQQLKARQICLAANLFAAATLSKQKESGSDQIKFLHEFIYGVTLRFNDCSEVVFSLRVTFTHTGGVDTPDQTLVLC